jgi:hypothetical protein
MAPSWWGCLYDVCFASKKSYRTEFFVPARTDLGVELLKPTSLDRVLQQGVLGMGFRYIPQL